MGAETNRIPTVSAAAFKGKEVLLVKHGEGASHLTGVYGLPGGRLEEGESLLDAAAREFEEETGLVAEKDSMKPIQTVFEATLQRKGGEVLETRWQVFAIQNFSGELKGTDEATPEWVDIDQMLALNLLPNTEVAAREALALIQTNL